MWRARAHAVRSGRPGSTARARPVSVTGRDRRRPRASRRDRPGSRSSRPLAPPARDAYPGAAYRPRPNVPPLVNLTTVLRSANEDGFHHVNNRPIDETHGGPVPFHPPHEGRTSALGLEPSGWNRDLERVPARSEDGPVVEEVPRDRVGRAVAVRHADVDQVAERGGRAEESGPNKRRSVVQANGAPQARLGDDTGPPGPPPGMPTNATVGSATVVRPRCRGSTASRRSATW